MGGGSIDLGIQVYTNKLMLVRVYLDKGRVADTSKSAGTVNNETLWRPYKTGKQTKQGPKWHQPWPSRQL